MMKKNLCASCIADCRHYLEPGEFVVECGAYRPPVTNADHIRAMSDEELSRHCNGCPPGKDYMTCEFVGACDACWLEWLQQPAEEGRANST